jgi:hypothetical protein
MGVDAGAKDVNSLRPRNASSERVNTKGSAARTWPRFLTSTAPADSASFGDARCERLSVKAAGLIFDATAPIGHVSRLGVLCRLGSLGDISIYGMFFEANDLHILRFRLGPIGSRCFLKEGNCTRMPRADDYLHYPGCKIRFALTEATFLNVSAARPELSSQSPAALLDS